MRETASFIKVKVFVDITHETLAVGEVGGKHTDTSHGPGGDPGSRDNGNFLRF